MKLIIISLILNVIGALMLTIAALTNRPYVRVYDNGKWKGYEWSGWNPFLKITPPSGKIERKIKLSRKVPKSGFFPPTHKLNIFGFVCILAGFFIQLLFYI